MKLKIIALILGIAMLTAGLAYGHVVNGVTYTDRNASAQNIIGNNSDMYGNTMGNGRLQDVTCITNCTGYSGIAGGYNQTTNAGIYDANGWTGNITAGGFTLFGFHGVGNMGAGYGFYAGDGSSDPVLLGSNTIQFNQTYNSTEIVPFPYQVSMSTNNSIFANITTQTNTAYAGLGASIRNYGAGNAVGVFGQGINNQTGNGEVWGLNGVGYSTTSSRSTAIEADYGCLRNPALNCSSVGVMIVSQAYARPDEAMWLFSATNESRPQHLIKIEKVVNSSGKQINPIDPSGTLILANTGFTAAYGMDFSGNTFTGSAIALPMLSKANTGHGVNFVEVDGGNNEYLDTTPNQTRFANATNVHFAIDTANGNITIPALASTTANQSILAVNNVGNLTRYTPKYHDETANRAQATVYTNRAGTPITVIISFNQGTTAGTSIQVDSTDVALIGGASDVSTYKTLYAVVPAGSTYGTTGTGLTILHWNEVY